MRSGFVSIVGRPNVGKSTLLNSIIGSHVAITSDISGTTRTLIEGIYHEKDTQIIFIDTPGIAKPLNKLGKIMNKEAFSLTKDVDAILLVVDIASGIGRGDRFLIESLKESNIPVILIINKIDRVSKETLIMAINEFKDYHFAEIVPISALKRDNLDHLITVIKKYLSDDIKYYDDDVITSLSTKFMVAEVVREKLLHNLKDEIPHSVTCNTIGIEVKKDIVNINVDIIVDRDNIKGMVIGAGGSMLKKIGSLAREDLEEMFDKKVYLELYVKVIDNWKDKEKYLKELGLFNDE